MLREDQDSSLDRAPGSGQTMETPPRETEKGLGMDSVSYCYTSESIGSLNLNLRTSVTLKRLNI